ncbi:MAG: NAD-dependent epimerase/dehydratase family protein [Methylotenera sp.]
MQVAAVWGANGYIGKHLVSALINSGYTVKVLVRDIASLSEDLLNQVEKHEIDFTSSISEISNVLRGVQILYCCAGSTKHEKYAEDYVSASEKVMLSAVNCSIRRVVMLSTVAVYGKAEEDIINTNFAINPQTPYAKARVASENAMMAVAKVNSIQLCVVRIPMVIGIGMTSKALKSLLNSLAFGCLFFPGSKNATLNCIGINRIVMILVTLANIKLTENVIVMQFSDNVKWVDIIKLYANSAKKKITVVHISKVVLKFISLITFNNSNLNNIIQILGNKTRYQDDSTKFLTIQQSNDQTIKDINEYINLYIK